MYPQAPFSRRGFLTSALAATACVRGRAEEPKSETPPYNKMSDEQEIKLGREVAAAIEKEKDLKFIEAHSIRGYVNDIFERITKTSRRPHLPYSIKIVDTKEINAFALPGGFTYINRGLMEWARSESEMVATLAHEVGHVAGHHGANTISRESSVDSLLSEASQVIFGDDLPARLLKQAGGPLVFFANLKYSRLQELQADLFGYYNMQRAGWNPKGMVELFHHFGESSSIVDPFFTIVSTHPASSEREDQIVEEMRQFPPRPGLRYDSDDFRAMRADLKRMPPPRVRQNLSSE